MKLEKLGDNLYKVKVPWYSLSLVSPLIKAILDLTREGKLVVSVTKTGMWAPIYLICTTDK